MIPLAKETISKNEIDKLIEFLKTYPILTKNNQTLSYELESSEYFRSNYSILVNSGSSANWMALYAFLLKHKNLERKKIKVIVPALSWLTTVSPIFHMDLHPILCDSEKDTLGVDLNMFEDLCKQHSPKVAIIVHVLGIPANIIEIKKICDRYSIYLIEDTCESSGSKMNDKFLGTFGDVGTFSHYYGHNYSGIESGTILLKDKKIYELMLMMRSHGWSRDLSEKGKNILKLKYNVDDFQELFTFYIPGFNFRATDIQAFLLRNQLKRLPEMSLIRNKNFQLYNSFIKNDYWKINPIEGSYVVNQGYPLISPKREQIVKVLKENEIECRPLIAGSIGRQPFWTEKYGIKKMDFADIVHKYGMYLPNNAEILEEEIKMICEIINGVINE